MTAQLIDNIGYSTKDISNDINELGLFHLGVWLGQRNLFPAMYDGYYHVSKISYECFMTTEMYNILTEIKSLTDIQNVRKLTLDKLYYDRDISSLVSSVPDVKNIKIQNLDEMIESEKEITNIASQRIEYLKEQLNNKITD